jgi:hypothetical protein
MRDLYESQESGSVGDVHEAVGCELSQAVTGNRTGTADGAAGPVRPSADHRVHACFLGQ